MTGFQGIVTGNIANTPITKTANMSPSEIAAFEANNSSESTSATTTATDCWELIDETSWSEPMFGQAISNSFRRVTRRMPVSGGYLYSVATYGLCYVRGTANSNTSESLVFVPSNEAGEAPKAKAKK